MNGVAPSCRISETKLAVAQPKTPGKPKNSPNTGPNADAGRICTMSLNCGTARKPSRTARYTTKQAANTLNDRFQPDRNGACGASDATEATGASPTSRTAVAGISLCSGRSDSMVSHLPHPFARNAIQIRSSLL